MSDRAEPENLDPLQKPALDEGGISQKTPDTRDPQAEGTQGSFEVIELGERSKKDAEQQIELPEEKKETEKKELTASEAMVAALSRFIQEEASKPREENKKRTKFDVRQVVVLLLLTADLVLAYMSLPPEFMNVRVVKFVAALIPWLLGASAFAYADKLRGWFLARCGSPWIGGSSLLVFFILLPMQLPLFSTHVKFKQNTTLTAENTKGTEIRYEEGGANLLFSGLNSYTITVKNADFNIHNAKDLTLTLGRWQIAKTSLAQLPLIGNLFGSDFITLTPLYSFNVISSGSEDIEVEGDLPVPASSISEFREWTVKKKAGHYLLSRHIVAEATNMLELPSGTYDFRNRQGECWKVQKGWLVQGSNDKEVLPIIDFDALSCSGSN